MKERAVSLPEDVGELRSRMDADARFHRVLSGYDPNEVCAYVEEVRRVLFKQSKVAKQEQESLLAQLESAKNETQARNCAIKSLKETLAHREELLSEASTRVTTLIQSVKQMEAERAGLGDLRTVNEKIRAAEEKTRAAEEKAHAAEEKTQRMEQELQQWRTTLSRAANLIETWKDERVQLVEENMRLRQEMEYLRGLFQTVIAQKIETAPPVPVVQPTVSNPVRKEPDKVATAQLTDTLTDAFVEAYDLINKLRAIDEQKKSTVTLRPAQPRMQVLRPDGTAADCLIDKT